LLEKIFINGVLSRMNVVVEEESPKIKQASALIADSIASDGLLHVFGCGHSHILAEDLFYRAGGLVPINPILDSSLMLHWGAAKSSEVEQLEGYAKIVLDNYDVHAGEVMVIASNSGVNGVPVDMAIEAKARGLNVVGLTSLAYSGDKSRHSSGKKLCDIADIVIDNHLPHGDALVEAPGVRTKFAPASTIIGSFILNTLIVMVVENLVERGVEPKIYTSGNIPGGHELNREYIAEYRRRIKHL
jgi:uncharacterized phosphosugar-binding protein